MHQEELSAWLRLMGTHGVGNQSARRLLAAFGMPQAIFAQPLAALERCVPMAQAKALLLPPPGFDAQLQRTLAWLDAPRASAHLPARAICTLGDPDYPANLQATEDPPLLLYLEGAAHLLQDGGLQGACERALALVGSRNPTPQGRQNAWQFAKSLRESGMTIVSGLALGVDTAAHEGALAAEGAGEGAATVAVVGTGLDQVYPRANQALAARIARQGVIVSEYALGTPPKGENFPRRNRIISGLSAGTLVVEAAPASGSLITARLASEQGREVFAIPGSIHSPQSRGCHALIKQGAKLVETAQDILEELRAMAPKAPALRQAPLFDTGTAPALGTDLQSLLDAMGFDPLSFDAITARTGLDAASLQARLLELELEGHVARLPGALFQRLGSA